MKGFFALDLDVIKLGTGRRGSRWGADVVRSDEVNVKPKAHAKPKRIAASARKKPDPYVCISTPEPRSHRLMSHLSNPGTVESNTENLLQSDSLDSSETLPLPGSASDKKAGVAVEWESPSVWDSPSEFLKPREADDVLEELEMSSPEGLKQEVADMHLESRDWLKRVKM